MIPFFYIAKYKIGIPFRYDSYVVLFRLFLCTACFQAVFLSLFFHEIQLLYPSKSVALLSCNFPQEAYNLVLKRLSQSFFTFMGGEPLAKKVLYPSCLDSLCTGMTCVLLLWEENSFQSEFFLYT